MQNLGRIIARKHQIGKISVHILRPISLKQSNYGEKERFEDHLHDVIDSVVRNPLISQNSECSSWMQNLMEYSLTGGKMLRGIWTVAAYEAAEIPQNITQDNLKMARTLGWCQEILSSYVLILDDVIDGSSTRRGKPCWYTLQDVGLGAIKDVLLMQCSLFEILKANVSQSPHYLNILEIFNRALLYTTMGEHVETSISQMNKGNYDKFTMENYEFVAQYKTGYCIFKLPIILGYLLAGHYEKDFHANMHDICAQLGKFYQIQNDMLDCFGDEAITGKKGNDIEEGKCTWLSVNALRLCSAAQRAEFVHNYAHSDPARVQAVKQLYQDLNLPQLYHQEEENLYKTILDKADALPTVENKLIIQFLNMTHKRII